MASSFAAPRLHVENWDPGYGAPLEPSEAVDFSAGEIDLFIETRDWSPLAAPDEVDADTLAFIDGVRRVDARLTLDDPVTGPVSGLCGSYAAGAVVWDRRVPSSEIAEVAVHRLGLLCEGRGDELPEKIPFNLHYQTEAIASNESAALVQELQTRMRNEEGRLATDMARAGHLVIADGPIKALGGGEIVGCVKRHRRSYLQGRQAAVVGELVPGERTPLFLFDVESYRRYSWYVRLDDVIGGHSWSGIMRCECLATLSLEKAVRLADHTAALLPQVASAQHIDPRAPQNLVPISGLERHLKHLLGDPALIYRALCEALGQTENGVRDDSTPAPPFEEVAVLAAV